MSLVYAVNVGIASFSMMAACCWLLAAIQSPKALSEDGTPTRRNANAFRDIEEIHSAMQRQTRWNAAGAACAAVAAFLAAYLTGLIIDLV